MRKQLDSIPPERKRLIAILLAIGIAGVVLVREYKSGATNIPKPLLKASATFTPTRTPTRTATATVSPTDTATAGPTATGTDTPTDTATPGAMFTPWPAAPLCPDTGAAHDNSLFHTLWDSVRGCHYDHEHGQNPFTPEVAAEFPGFDLRALLGGVGVGHTNPSGPTEFTIKHGGFKWNVQLHHPQTCAGFQDGTIGVDGSVIQIHGFGNYSVELEASIHSSVALLRECQASDPTDYGYIFTVQHVSYGEVASPYQGDLLHYPYYSVPDYDPSFGMYLTAPCIGEKLPGQRGACRSSLALAQAHTSDSNWASNPTGLGARAANSSLLRLLWRVGDTPQMFDWSDQTYPYSFLWLCTSDGGATYNPVACKFTNSTTQVHEIYGEIPASWATSGLFTVEVDAHGNTRLTGEAFTTQFGELVSGAVCQMPGMGCHPVKLVRAFVGKYGSVLVFTPGKGTNIVPFEPSRNIYFCGGVVCAATDPGAVPSGWIGSQN